MRRARRSARRSRARRRGCSGAAPRSGGRSAPARCSPAQRARDVARRGCRRAPGARRSIASEPSCRWPWRSWCSRRARGGDPRRCWPGLREVAEGADHADGLVARQVLQQPVERAAGRASRSAGRPPRAWRTRSTSSNASLPSCSRIVSPRMRPSSRMSSTSGRFFSAASPASSLARRRGALFGDLLQT